MLKLPVKKVAFDFDAVIAGITEKTIASTSMYFLRVRWFRLGRRWRVPEEENKTKLGNKLSRVKG